MTQSPSVIIHTRDVELEAEVDERFRGSIERRCQHLADEFHEASRFELTLTEAGAGYQVHGHATGKNTDVATHADASDAVVAADLVLDRIEKQLRRSHDKRIFSQRRDAQKDPPKRRSG